MVKILGIEFAPLRVPFERRLQTLAVTQYTLCFLFLGFSCLFLTIYILFFTQYYYLMLLYLAWMYYDRDVPERGGRRSDSVRRWRIWEYLKDYFPAKLIKTAELSPQKNYILGFHPHGIMSTSAFVHFASEGSGWSRIFPGITSYLLVLGGHFMFPVYRDYLMLSGTVAVTKSSMNFLLRENGTGNALVLVVGGALEALEAFPGRFNLKLNKRKGFIKMALETGTSLVPTFSFGELNLYHQMENPPGSFLRRLQNVMTRYLGFSPPVFHGRGVFNYTYGLVPYRQAINTVIGAPIDVEKVDRPSQTQIDQLHAQYLAALRDLFNTHKENYGVDPSNELHFID
ncbi:2-acylglycerol O-acyltransferase 2-B-like [Ylistrum balloti]|uniref:2-acylglycerol O-acyltransferase 2-B-like n=1 Tax=Ylistrum balloti TaxID=509963 RepID=UPI002905887F|nr:2-acylglycerol O-acyltransferase 2-B-like [Ylistrum balloti]